MRQASAQQQPQRPAAASEAAAQQTGEGERPPEPEPDKQGTVEELLTRARGANHYEVLGVARGVKLPQGYPGTWNYWVEPAAGRGGAGDFMRLADIERLQLSLRREPGMDLRPGSYGVEVESVDLVFYR